ncbi:hypothetical protein, partial [Aquipuribacter sp. MA13-6]
EVFRAPPGQYVAEPAAAVSPERTAALRAHGWTDTVHHLDDDAQQRAVAPPAGINGSRRPAGGVNGSARSVSSPGGIW